jgi:predicted lipoprotein with Yx(FWY)xxD motif
VSRIIYALCLAATVTVAIGGCGGGDSTSSESAYGGKGGGGGKPASETSEAGAGGDGVVSAAEVGDLGMILVDSEGRTLYDFHRDKGSKSACYGACAGAWPPLLTDGDPQAQGPADRSMLGTTRRKDGTVQVTYNGWPLYTYVGDKNPGEANGNDIDQFGAEWYALQPNGKEPED